MGSPAAWAVLALAALFTYTNGFHDAPNAVATSITTRALTPRMAVALAAAGNLAGAFLGAGLAEVVARGLVDVDAPGLGVALGVATFVAATLWNLWTWWRGMPSSSSHALLSGLVGAALAAGLTVHWDAVGQRVLLPLLLSPVIGLLGGWAVLRLVRRRFARRDAFEAHGLLRDAQTVSAGMLAIGHGMQDAAKPAGVLVLATTASTEPGRVPAWVLFLLAVVLAAGTYAGGWRIMRTLGRRIVDLDTPAGFAAESATAVVLAGATALGAPISSTHTLASAIVGAGVVRGRRSVRWHVVVRIVLTWLATPLVTAVLAAGVAWGLLAVL